MKNRLIILLIIVSCTNASMAQIINDTDRQKIIDYINCFYTAKYVQKLGDTERQAIKNKKIDVISIETALKYDTLYHYLEENSLSVTADNLTKILNERNRKIDDNLIYKFIEKATTTTGIEKFGIEKADESLLRNSIWKWYFSKYNQNKLEKNNKESTTSAHLNESFPIVNSSFEKEHKYLILFFVIVLILGCYMVYRKLFRKGEFNDNPTSHNGNLDLDNKSKESKYNRQEKEIKSNVSIDNSTETHDSSNSQQVQIKPHEGTSCINIPQDQEKNNVDFSVTTPQIYYTELDVNNNVFVRTNDKITKRSVYIIDINKQTFILIENKQLYAMLLMKPKYSGILEACEVKGIYSNDKNVVIVPGKVQKEENGKWRIIDKAKIEIK